MKKYDGLYIFANSAKDEVLNKQIEKVCGEITRLSGKVLNTDVLGKRSFARPMHKRDSGVFVKIRFEMEQAQIKTLVARYRLSEEVFRVQVLAVDERREAVLDQQAETHRAREAAREAAAAEKEAAAQDSRDV